jgi:hypothetical protein
MKIIFPNPAGYKLPTKAKVLAYQKQQGFSDQYAEFLITKNGFSFDDFEKNTDNSRYLAESDSNSEGCSDLRVIYGFESGDEYYDLAENQLGIDIFKDKFFAIGVGYGGNDFVEVLAGKYKGYIGSLDHEMYAGSDTWDEFTDNFEMEGYEDAELDHQANMLVDPDLGLIWLHATCMNEFVAECIHLSESGDGFARDADSVANLD